MEESKNVTDKTSSLTVEDRRAYGILRRCVERLGHDLLLDYTVKLATENPEVHKQISEILSENKEIRKVFLRSIPSDSTRESLCELLKPFGEVDEVTIVMDQQTKKSKNIAFVSFKKIESTLKALQAGKIMHEEETVFIHFAVPQNKADPARPQNKNQSRERLIFIRNVTEELTIDDIQEEFNKYGIVEDCNMPKDKVSGKNKGYAFVKYYSADDAAKAVRTNKKTIKNTVISCDFSAKRKNPMENMNMMYNNKMQKNMMDNYSRRPQMQDRGYQQAYGYNRAPNMSYGQDQMAQNVNQGPNNFDQGVYNQNANGIRRNYNQNGFDNPADTSQYNN